MILPLAEANPPSFPKERKSSSLSCFLSLLRPRSPIGLL